MNPLRLSAPAFLLGVASLVPCSAACGDVEPEPPPCPEAPPTCVVPAEACGSPRVVPAVCADQAWSCPAASQPYVRAPEASSTCLPFSGDGSPFSALGGSFARLPIDGGRCLWIAETATTTDGSALRNVGLIPAAADFGACPGASTFAGGQPTEVVAIDGRADGSLLVQIDGGFLYGGGTKVLYRLFKSDPAVAFGVTLLGGGFGAWDATRQRVVVPGPDHLAWGPSLAPGDASVVVGGTPYVFGCHAPAQLLDDPCAVARLDTTGLAFLTAGGDWVPGASVAATSTVFTSGPWISSVVPSPSHALLHVYAPGFGTTLETHTAAQAAGPWAAGPTLAACELPTGDAKAFCAGPVVHEELSDPTRPGELVVSYGVGTTASTPAETGTLSTSYWTRLAWTTVAAE